jgi:tRNA(Ile)-lysidine synthase
LLLRPLLYTSRAEIEAYCRDHQLQPRHDATNQDTRFRRNWLRHELLPQLVAFNPQIKRHLQQMADHCGRRYGDCWTILLMPGLAAVNDIDEDWLALDRPIWQRQPLALRRRLLRGGAPA